MDLDDGSDLLGGSTLPVVQNEGRRWFIIKSFSAIIGFCVILGLYYFVVKPRYLEYRERNHRKQLRRRYGIPDDDNDVFNVAYARAVRRKQEEERKQRDLQRSAQVAGPSTSGNSNLTGKASIQNGFDSGYSSGVLKNNAKRRPPTSQHLLSGPRQAQEEHVVNGHAQPYANSAPRDEAQVMPGSVDPVANSPASERVTKPRGRESPRKRAKGADLERDGDATMDIPGREGSLGHSAHLGSKRQLATTEDARKRLDHKKARRLSEKRSFQNQYNEDDEDRDQLMELDQIPRGHKRDRAEAGSTFGADEDSPQTHERKVRRRKRKSGVDGIEPASRGTKRSLEVESTLDSDGDDRRSSVKASRKRGKRRQPNESATDESMDDMSIQIDPLCGDRQIGEEWHANGQLWRVGPRGQRQRQALVKKRRSRYSMPVDSQHPDSQAQMVVLIERWLDDDEYKELEERGDIFSQKDEAMTVVNDNVAETPNNAGKQLLWQSPKRTFSGSRSLFKDSIVTNVSLNTNPFEQPSSTNFGRRVSAGPAVFRVSTGDVPLLKHSKSYSKWEKQELEAEAMSKLRKRLEEQKKLATPEAKRVTFELPTSLSAPAISKAPSNVSTPPLSSVPPSAVESVTSTTSATGESNKPAISLPTISSPFVAQPKAPVANVQSADKTVPQKASSEIPAVSKPSPFTFGTAPQSDASKPKETANAPPTAPPSSASGSTGTTSTTFSSGDKSSTASAAAPSPFSFPPMSKPATSSASSSFFTPPTASGVAPSPFQFKSSGQTATAAASPAVPTPSSAIPSQTPASTSIFGAKPITSVASNPGAAAGSTNAFTNTAFSGANPASSPFSFSGAASQNNTSASKPAETAAASAATAPKFNFGFMKPPVVSAPTSAPTPSATAEAPRTFASPVPAPSVVPAPSPFKFATPTPQATTSTSTTNAATSTSTPKFSFGFSGSSSTPAQALPPAPVPASTSTTETSTSKPEITVTSPAGTSASQPSTPFSFNFGGSSGGSNDAKPSPFAAAATANKPTSSPFSFGAKTSDVPKPLFGTGIQATTPSATPTSENKPAFSFSFGASGASNAAGGSTPSASTLFGAKTTTTPTFGATTPASTTAQQNPFGAFSTPAGSTPSPFGASNNTSTFGSGSAFGFSSSANNQKS